MEYILMDKMLRDSRLVVVMPTDHDYADIRYRNDRALDLFDRRDFEEKSLRGALAMLLAQLTGAP